jgi:hypothetical protein
MVSDKALEANQRRAFDASMFIEYMEASLDGSGDTEKFLYDRFRPEMRRAVDAWLATAPFDDPEAPPHPFQPHWYELPEEQEASRLQEQGEMMFGAAQEMNQISDTYVLMTVLFASILFFGGIAGTFRSRKVEAVFGFIALVLFLAAASFMLTLPVCRDCDVLDAGSAGVARTSGSDLPTATPVSKDPTTSLGGFGLR